MRANALSMRLTGETRGSPRSLAVARRGGPIRAAERRSSRAARAPRGTRRGRRRRSTRRRSCRADEDGGRQRRERDGSRSVWVIRGRQLRGWTHRRRALTDASPSLGAGRCLLLDACATLYRPRRPRESPLYRLVDELYDRVKGNWEERFERSYGFWRGRLALDYLGALARCHDLAAVALKDVGEGALVLAVELATLDADLPDAVDGGRGFLDARWLSGRGGGGQ